MHFNSKSRLPYLLTALLLIAAPLAQAERGGGRSKGHGEGGQGSGRGYARHGGGGHGEIGRGGYSSKRNYARYNRGWAAPNRGYSYGGGYSSGRFYAGRGYFYGGSFWARPYFGIGIGIPFGYGYQSNRGCGYVDGYGDFYPAPCYSEYYSGY